MQTKLDQLLSSLEPQELRELRRFLQSSFLNPRPEVVPLFDFLTETPREGPFPDREAIAAALYPGEEVPDLKVRRLMSYLTKGIEKYLAWVEFESTPLAMDLQLLKAYRRKRLSKGFHSVSNRIEKHLREQALGDENYHFNQFSLHQERYNFSANRTGKEAPKIDEILAELDNFYIVNKLKQACNALSHQRLFKYEYDIALLDALLEHIQKAELQRIPAIGIYYQSYMTLASEDERHFFSLRKQMDTYIHLFDEEDRRSIFMLAINYCIRQLNKGRANFLREVFELYQKALEGEILLENGQLSHLTYKNIVSAALKLEEFEWTGWFLEQYRKQLAEKIRDHSYAFNKAKLFFARGAFREALRLLLPIGFEDLFTQLDARVLIIKCYFELQELDAVEYQLDSFRHLLRRKKLLTYHREHYLSFVDFTRALVRNKENPGLGASILKREVLAEKDWLLRQLPGK